MTPLQPHRLIPLFVATYLLVGWMATILLDFCISPLVGPAYNPSLLDDLFFLEPSTTEVLGYLFLIGGALGTAGCIAYRHRQGRVVGAGWWILLVGFVLLYLEDAHNVRHALTDLAGAESGTLLQGAIEGAFYLFLATVMVSALALILRQRSLPRRAIGLFLVGYTVYGTVGFASASRHLVGWNAPTTNPPGTAVPI